MTRVACGVCCGASNVLGREVTAFFGLSLAVGQQTLTESKRCSCLLKSSSHAKSTKIAPQTNLSVLAIALVLEQQSKEIKCKHQQHQGVWIKLNCVFFLWWKLWTFLPWHECTLVMFNALSLFQPLVTLAFMSVSQSAQCKMHDCSPKGRETCLFSDWPLKWQTFLCYIPTMMEYV